VPLSLELLIRLKNSFPGRFGGLKDSSSEIGYAHQIGSRFGTDLLILNGNDSMFKGALESGAVGCITALANLRSPDLRAVWDAHMRAENDPYAQARLKAAREVMERYRPFAPTLKSLLPRFHNFPVWQVRPPLLPLIPEVADQAEAEMRKAITSTDYNPTKT
jgi:4-hydroxy-tetrahydrodipicolinate synthase